MTITNQQEYEAAKLRQEELIAEATKNGLLEPDMDNHYTREIAALSISMADYEDQVQKILPLREKSPLIRSVEDYMYAHHLRHKEGARMLGVNESAFSQILCGKRRFSMTAAKRLHTRWGIDAHTILEYV